MKPILSLRFGMAELGANDEFQRRISKLWAITARNRLGDRVNQPIFEAIEDRGGSLHSATFDQAVLKSAFGFRNLGSFTGSTGIIFSMSSNGTQPRVLLAKAT